MFGCQQVLISDTEILPYLEFICSEANKLINCGTYYGRQIYFIEFVETEESYTSKASFLDDDILPTFGAKLEGWTASGRRVYRGLYKTAAGHLVGADTQAAANIIRKVSTQLNLDLARVCRAVLILPKRINVFRHVFRLPKSILCESPRL